MLDLHEGVAELFDEAGALLVHGLSHQWPLYRPRHARPRQTRRERVAKYLARQRADRAQIKSARARQEPPPPLPFPMSCRFCRRGVHCLRPHVANCKAAPAWARGWNGTAPAIDVLELVWEATG